jgi:6-phosphofructokinase 1
VVDTLVGAILKRLAFSRRDGVAVIAEGLALRIDPKDLAGVEGIELDDHGNPRLAEINLAEILKNEVQKVLKNEFKVRITIVAKDIGYELRCADPIPLDMEYARDLGYCAAKYLLQGGGGVMVSIQGGHFVPIPFEKLLDPATGRTKVRLVDIRSTRYAIARRYMIRIRRDDFDEANIADLEAMAKVAGLSVEDFRRRFEYLVKWEPPPLVLQMV